MAEWERTHFAHEVAQRVIADCVEHQLTQTELARKLGLALAMLARLARAWYGVPHRYHAQCIASQHVGRDGQPAR